MTEAWKIPVATPLFTDRFWAKVDDSAGPEGCWLWTAWTTQDGYGLFSVDGKGRGAHRVAYQLILGPIPEGMQLDHLCRVRNCVNPAHLEPVTSGENTRRGTTGHNMRSKTHCPQGHAYDEANTHIDKTGRRHCRRCNADRMAARKERDCA